MPLLLKQSTAVVISFGPLLLNTDGTTLVTDRVGTGANQTENTSSGIRISKNGAAFIARSATATASVYDAIGNYLVTLSTTDTNTLGILRMQFAVGTLFCPVWQDFLVVPANVYDSLVAGSDVLDVSAVQILGTAISTPATAGVLDVNLKNIANAAVNTASAQLGVNAVQAGAVAWGSGAITAASIATDAIGANELSQAAADKVWATTTRALTDKDGFALSTAGILALWHQLTSAIVTAGTIGKLLVDNVDAAISSRMATFAYTAPDNAGIAAIKAKTDNLPASPANEATLTTISGYLDTEVGAILAAVDTEVGAIKATTDQFAFTIANQVDANALTGGGGGGLDAAGVRAAVGLASANLDTQIAAVQADTDNIQTRVPATLVSGRMDASVGAMAIDVLTAASLSAGAVTEIQSGLSTLTQAQILSDVTPFAGANIALIKTDTTSLINRIGAITGSGVNTVMGFLRAIANKAVGVATPTDLSTGGTFDNTTDSLEAISDGSGGSGPTVQQIVDGVWDEPIASHLDAGSTGETLDNASGGSAPTVGQIDTQLSASHGAGLWGGSSGTGFYTVQIPTEVSGVPADGVQAQVTNDIGGLNIVAQAISDTNGNATVYLDAGTYYVWLQRGGDTFPNPTQITVP